MIFQCPDSRANPIAEDIEVFCQAGVELDMTRVQYILDGVRSLAGDLDGRIGEAEAKNFQVEFSSSMHFYLRVRRQAFCESFKKALNSSKNM